jgi:hypothetical protein
VILDPDFPLLEEVAVILDAQLDRIAQEAHRSEDPDADGIYDRLEHVTGLGFVACQNYIVSCAGRCRISKQLALQLGPKHRTGQPMAALINGAANYWKHRPSWDENNAAPVPRTVELFSSLSVPFSEYALTNVLHELLRPLPPRFATVLPFLVHWRDALADA